MKQLTIAVNGHDCDVSSHDAIRFTTLRVATTLIAVSMSFGSCIVRIE